MFVALAYPTRQGLPEYLAYQNEVESTVARINQRWATPGWTPIVLEVEDDYHASLAALLRYDVLLVNPVRDGLNLVAKEGPLINARHGVLALSREAGAFDELSPAALEVNPFDVSGTAAVLAEALDMTAPQRARARRRARATDRGPAPGRLAGRPTDRGGLTPTPGATVGLLGRPLPGQPLQHGEGAEGTAYRDVGRCRHLGRALLVDGGDGCGGQSLGGGQIGQGGEGGEVAEVVAQVAGGRTARRQRPHDRALVGVGGRPELDRHAPRMGHEAGVGRL